MKKIFNLLIAVLAIFGVACVPSDNGGNSGSTNTFVISVTDITSGGAIISVTPSNNETYYFDVISKAKVDSYSTPLEFATKYIANLKSSMEEYEEPFEYWLSSGYESRRYFHLNPEVEYYVVAFGVAVDAAVTTDVALKGFKTLPDNGEPSNNTFSISVTDITSSNATVSVTPSNNDTYHFDIVEKSDLDQYTSDSMFFESYLADMKSYIDEFNQQYSTDITFANFVSSGNDEFTYKGDFALEPDTEYYAFAFGMTTGGKVTTGLTKVAFKTLTVEKVPIGIDSGDMNIEGLVGGGYVNYKDYYEVGAAEWLISLYDESRKGSLTIDLLLDLSATEIPVGEYPINSTFAPGTVIAGTLDENDSSIGTFWKLSDDDWKEIEMAYLKTGTVTIDKSGETFTINVNAIDDYGNTITASYSGVLEYHDYSSSAQKLNASHNLVLRKATPAKFVPKNISRPGVLVGKKVEQILSIKTTRS